MRKKDASLQGIKMNIIYIKSGIIKWQTLSLITNVNRVLLERYCRYWHVSDLFIMFSAACVSNPCNNNRESVQRMIIVFLLLSKPKTTVRKLVERPHIFKTYTAILDIRPLSHYVIVVLCKAQSTSWRTIVSPLGIW